MPADKSAKVEPTGDIARMVALPDAQACAGVGRDVFGRSAKVVAGRGFEPLTFRL